MKTITSVMTQCKLSHMLESQVSGVSEYQCVTDSNMVMPAKNCCTITSIRKGNLFESAHLPLRTLINMIYYRSIELPT